MTSISIEFPETVLDALILLFRFGAEEDVEIEIDEFDETEIPGIRCPLCKWRPGRGDTWTCWDCDHPEYFYDGCGTAWNTFETRGVCPTCCYQWKWTSCYRCFIWSKHEDWYEED